MKLNPKQLIAVALAGACIATSGSYVALAQDAAVDPATDPAVVDQSLSGVLATPPPTEVQIVVPEVVGDVANTSVASPEEEDLTAGVNVDDPGPIMPVDPGALDSAVVANVGTPPDALTVADFGVNTADGSTPGGGGECSVSPAAPTKQEMRIWASGSISCGSVQRSLNLVVCIDYREAGVWEQLTCKGKTVSNAKSTSKKASTPCVPGRFFYRTRVNGAATSQGGVRTSIPTRTAATGSRIPCAA